MTAQSSSDLAESTFSWKTYVPAMLVAGLGFLVDVYDVLLFAVLRVPSLVDLGVTSNKTLDVGIQILNMQMIGLLVGGIVWGVIGDKFGRRSALFGSIACYSIANLLCSFVHSIETYEILRFVAGFGLAGEVGAAMTVAAELTPAKYRTFGTAFVSVMGVLGSLLASWSGASLPWRTAYLVAGGAGLVLLCIRASMKDTAMFEKMKAVPQLERGSLMLLISSPKRLLRMLCCVLAALPLFFVFGVLVSFAPELHQDQASSATAVATVAVFYSIGETVGECVSGVLSQLARSRKLIMLLFQIGALICTVLVFCSSASTYAYLCLPLGFFVGYWALVITSTSEQFGTNIRSTATTIVPNLMRACHIPINLLFASLAATFGSYHAAAGIATLSYVLGFICVLAMEETFGKELDFFET